MEQTKTIKVRCFVVDATAGTPLAGITVSLSITSDKGAEHVLGVLASDRAGYLSFDISRFASLLPKGQLWLTPLAEPASRVSVPIGTAGAHIKAGTFALVLDHATGTVGPCVPVILPLKHAGKTAGDGRKPAIPAVQNPDPCDYTLSPGSFVTASTKFLGEGGCETIVPRSLPAQTYVLRRVVARSSTLSLKPGSEASASAAELKGVQAIDVSQPPKAPPVAATFGEVLEYRQEWHPLGHSLGEIRYSLALAPGEATEIAVVDWSRQDQASRTDSITSTEYLANQLNRDRSIDETVNAMLNETQDGWSLLGGTASAGTFTYGPLTVSADHAIGGAIAHSAGNRNLGADSLQTLHDSTNQATAVTRTLNSTVIVQSTQAEQNVLQTRRVANHNHCHALTIEYYEVLRNFRLRTRFAGRRKAILIPFQPFTFDWKLAVRFRSLLEPNLLDPSLATDFDALLRYHFGSALYQAGTTTPTPTPTPTPSTSNYFTGHQSLTIDATKPNDPHLFIQKGSRVRMSASGEINDGALVGGSYGADGSSDIAPDNGWYAPGKHKYSLVCKVGSTWYQGGTSGDFVTTEDDFIVFQVNDEVGALGDNSGSWAVELDVIAPAAATPAPTDPSQTVANTSSSGPTKDGDAFAEAVLLQHLNGNRGYYNRVIWLAMDDSDRRIYIEAALANDPLLAASVDATPLAVSGNIVAFGYDGSIPDWTDKKTDDPTDPLESIVTLPTRGVFAEAMLGHCNACEQRDVTRMWDWTVMTTEEPPAITDISPGPRGTPDTATQGTLPQAVVQISQPPAAPDPVGLAAALHVLGTPNIFRDMSGLSDVSSLLNGLVSGAISLDQARSLAKTAQNKLNAPTLGSGGGAAIGGGSAGTSPSRPQSAGDLYDKLQVLKHAVDQGLLTQGQAQQGAANYVQGDVVPASLWSPETGIATLIAHLGRWAAWNFDGSTGKDELHAEQTSAHYTGATDITMLDIGREAASAVKCQLHAVNFTSALDMNALVALFDGFAALSDPSVAQCDKISNTASLTLQDEFRWRIPLPSGALDAMVLELGPVLTGPAGLAALPAIRSILGQMAERRFDVRVIALDTPTSSLNQFTITVQTLADHPYGGRRAWRVKPTGQTVNGQAEYRFETVEFNSYSWLPDYFAEKVTHAAAASLCWTQFLKAFVTKASGTTTDASQLNGTTVLMVGTSRADAMNQLLGNALMQQIETDYPTIKQEADRQVSAISL